MIFGEILRELLENKDITQRQLAESLNIGTTTIGNYVRGLREPDFETLKLIADYFGVTTDYLLDFRSTVTKDHREDELLQVYRSLSESDKELLLEQGKLLAKRNMKK